MAGKEASQEPMPTADREKNAVLEFWDRAACGEIYAAGTSRAAQFEEQRRLRYQLEPYILDFARFGQGRGRDVLEIGVGMGADHVEWARSEPRSLSGVDLTPRAVSLTQERLALHGLKSDLRVGDAESLPFPDASFDLVYSWGVLHHSPDTARAVSEVRRVLRPGGVARVMIYHRWSLVGAMLWTRYGLASSRPWDLDEVYSRHLESPGTKAYSVAAARCLFAGFSNVEIGTQLSFGDLLLGEVGQRHRGVALTAAKAVYPRWLVRRMLGRFGLYLTIEATR